MVISLARIGAILQAEDIEGLLSLGAPKDEYSHEAAEIKSALADLDEDNATQDQISALVMNVWKRSFGPLSDGDVEKRFPAFRQLAQRILDDRR